MPRDDPRAEERESKRASLHDVMELAARFFEEALQSRAGAAARGYLQVPRPPARPPAPLPDRLRAGRAERAQERTSPARTSRKEQMIDAGLLIAGDDVPVSFDRFRDRVIFPIADFRGRIVGFGGRALSSDVPAKYLNSPETELFHKGNLLYNGAEARKAAHDAGTVVAVEGYVDVVRMVRPASPTPSPRSARR